MNGTVKFFNERKGFGFIAGEDGKDYFVHISDIDNQEILTDNENVEFDITTGDRGEKAVNVKRN